MASILSLKAQIHISKDIIPADSNGLILRKILFSENNKIDWEEAAKIIKEYHPEIDI